MLYQSQVVKMLAMVASADKFAFHQRHRTVLNRRVLNGTALVDLIEMTDPLQCEGTFITRRENHLSCELITTNS